MKLYHGTQSKNINSIVTYGLSPSDGGIKLTNSDTLQGQDICGIYGFTSLDDAKSFAMDNGCDGAVFAFDAADVINDPEYDDGAKFAFFALPVTATLVWQQWI
jgi:hypothetical protein